MNRAPERLCKLIEPVVTGMGYEAVGVEFDGRQGLLRVYIDRPTGITVDDCYAVSHQLSGMLDVEDPIPSRYTLEVSSPGLDRPLFTREHFARFIGSVVRLHLRQGIEGRRNFKGLLLSLADDVVSLEVDGATCTIPFDFIDSARLVPEFEAAPKGKRHGK